MNCTLSELKDKEVINVNDGKILGFITDVDIDVCSGRIIRIYLPPQGKYFSVFSSKNTISIPWDCIEKIGNDIILVRYFAPPPIPPSKKSC